MEKYFLVARNKKNDKFRIIGIDDRWYLDSSGFGCVRKANLLPAIDLVTSRFRNREQMIRRMYDNGFIDSMDVDLFVAGKRKTKDGEKLVTYEIIYDLAKSDRIKDFRKIARSFLDNKKEETVDIRRRVFDKLVSKSFYNTDYYMFIKDGMTNIPMRVINRLIGFEKLKKPPYGIKYKEGWVLDNFLAIRSIIESLNRFDLLEIYPDKVYANINFLNENALGRRKISRELMDCMDKELLTTGTGQLNLLEQSDKELLNNSDVNLSTADEIDKKQEVETDNNTINDTKGISLKNENEGDISRGEKLKEVLFTLDTLPLGVFKRNQDMTFFNEGVFKYYPSDEECTRLKGLIKGKRFLSQLYFYILHNNKSRDAARFGCSNLEICADLRADLKDLKKTLSKGKNLDNAYEWCKTYNKCVEFNELCMTGGTLEKDVEGKKFEKKNE